MLSNAFGRGESYAIGSLNPNPNPMVANNFESGAFAELPGFHIFSLGFIADGYFFLEFAGRAGLEICLSLNRWGAEHPCTNYEDESS